MPDDRWLLVQGSDDLGGVIGDLPQGLLGEDARIRPASSTVSGSSGQTGVSGTYPASSNNTAHRSQLEGSSHSPRMKATGIAVVAFARSICSSSCSVIGVGDTGELTSSSSVCSVYAGLVCSTVLGSSQSSKRVGAMCASSPGMREPSSSAAPKKLPEPEGPIGFSTRD
jgi:hypothetical protein